MRIPQQPFTERTPTVPVNPATARIDFTPVRATERAPFAPEMTALLAPRPITMTALLVPRVSERPTDFALATKLVADNLGLSGDF